jgi:hypothetical protein
MTEKKTIETDIIIIGAGPVGLFAIFEAALEANAANPSKTQPPCQPYPSTPALVINCFRNSSLGDKVPGINKCGHRASGTSFSGTKKLMESPFPLDRTSTPNFKTASILLVGIISSKSGFKGDVTSYQISVPLQPGNSAGPLFDFNGDLIGIVNAKLTIGENVSYAVKASYLRNLIELLPITPKLQTVNLIAGKNLTDQVKIINKYVYLVEVN